MNRCAFCCVLALLLGASAPSAHAAVACEGFKWNVADVRTLFAGKAASVTAAREVASAPVIETGRLYALGLVPQEDVRFALSPAKMMLADGASAGLVRLHVERAGTYRIAVDVPFWIDVVAQGQALASQDFNGDPSCSAPRKIVVYTLPAGDLLLQFSGHAGESVRATVTAVP
ncbi:MAG: hypothetical protein ACREVL_02060 [Solimonas sp.]